VSQDCRRPTRLPSRGQMRSRRDLQGVRGRDHRTPSRNAVGPSFLGRRVPDGSAKVNSKPRLVRFERQLPSATTRDWPSRRAWLAWPMARRWTEGIGRQNRRRLSRAGSPHGPARSMMAIWPLP
jgi:hypothetical protein